MDAASKLASILGPDWPAMTPEQVSGRAELLAAAYWFAAGLKNKMQREQTPTVAAALRVEDAE